MTYVENEKPTGLTALTSLASDDTIIVGDTSDTDETVKTITKANLKTDLGLTGTNSGDQTSIVGITGTKAQFDAAVTDGNILYVGDVTTNATHTGDATGSGALTVVALNGTTLSGLGTGLLKNTTGTGVPSIAVNSDLPAMTATVGGAVPTPPNNTTTFLRGDGTFATPAGSGDVSKVGTPVNNQIGVWTGDGTLEGDAALTFDTATDTLETVNIAATDIVVEDAVRIRQALLLEETNGLGDTVTIEAPASLTDSYVLTLPADAGSNTQILSTDGNGTLSWVARGITRTVTVTSGSATMGSSALTDYVYLVAGAHTMSLPAASGNTNRYTVKNNHSANITVDTAGAETIEGAASIALAPEESVDIISDGTNFRII